MRGALAAVLLALLAAVPARAGFFNQGTSFGSGATKSTFTATGSLQLAAGASLTIGGVAVVGSTPTVVHVCAPIIVGTLASGTTFMSFAPDAAIKLLRLTATIEVAGVIGGGDIFTCNNSAGTGVTVTSAAGAVAGTVTTAFVSGGAAIAYQAVISCHIDSTATTRPIANVCLEYIVP